MRDELIKELIKEVYGPRNGVEEEIESDPSKEYVTGVIIPQSCIINTISPDSESTKSEGNDPSREDDVAEDLSTNYSFSEIDPRTKPRLFGLSFVVSGDNPRFKICATWGRYEKDNSRKIWKRVPCKYIGEIRLDNSTQKIPIYSGKDGSIILHVRKVQRKNGVFVIIANVVNELTIKSDSCYGDEVTEASLFQASLRVKLEEGTTLSPFSDGRKLDEDVFEFLYRHKPVLAKGNLCSAIWSNIDYPEYFYEFIWPDGLKFTECKEFNLADVRTEFLPMFADPAPITEWDDSVGETPLLSSFQLSELWKEEELTGALNPLITSYKKWVEGNKAKISTLNGDDRRVGEILIGKQTDLLYRLEKGLEILIKNKEARISFCFANRTIWLQNRWKGKNDFIWRPFQLAFILINIEPLLMPESKYRRTADLLWVPTGGGKTEAYLGIMAFLIALRRRKSAMGFAAERTGGGTSILTRYTLRLLTTQQFRRTLSMITAAEYLRVQRTKYVGWRPNGCDIDGDWIYGSTRFSIGLWVGSSVTPNQLRGAGNALQILGGVQSGQESSSGEPAQLTTCPACGAWLSVPKSGLPDKRENKLHLIIQTTLDQGRLEKLINSHLKNTGIKNILDFLINSKNMDKSHFTITFKLFDEKKLGIEEIDEIWNNLHLDDVNLVPIRPSRPGYFGVRPESGRQRTSYSDFEIYCPDPECELNNIPQYAEGIPVSRETRSHYFPDGLYERKDDIPFFLGKRVPIPAYTVDEQVYHHNPTIVVSTADKIARLAYEPRAAGIFGNVDRYNEYYGYYRENILPKNTTVKAAQAGSVEITPFLPPELIVQDELHLLDGPLGSLFGLYENSVESLILERGICPKYIASTATIKHAEFQIKQLFARGVNEFPPHGLDIDDSFFVRARKHSDSWDESTPGRVYIGVYSSGWGPHTPNIRIWSRLLQASLENENDHNAKFYWTLVGYFNSLRELGGTRGLYRADIVERIGSIARGIPRLIEQENVVELSSRVNSTDIPQILDELERGNERVMKSNPDAIFTTSMFGTGVDIPHISLMVVNGQPKTNVQYIQATGRVGRMHGGLVVTFLRAGRPRDLSHYEIFPVYHQRKHIEVEPSSVFPFANGSLSRGSGPAMVSFLRNFVNSTIEWNREDGMVINRRESKDDIQLFEQLSINRLRNLFDSKLELDDVIEYFKSQTDHWKMVARDPGTNGLVFVEYPFGKLKKNVVLGDPYHKTAHLKMVFENAPQSLREVEETTGFVV